MKRRYAAALLAAIITAGNTFPTLAGQWQWQDMNGDGISECYYYDDNGNMLTNTTTPDGYTVDSNGAWVVNGVVQTQGTATSAYDSQYPLAGMLDQLGLNFATFEQLDPAYEYWTTDYLYWSSQYQNLVVGYDEAPNVIWNKVKETNNLNYYATPSSPDVMLAIAKLANVNVNILGADEAKAEALANNIREFFNNFPNWKTASDYEKACHIARWIEQAEYDNNTVDSGNEYGCLVNKKASCTGYTVAAKLLAQCVGLQAITGQTSVQNHIYPVFNINGVWLSYDASYNGTEQSFRIHDVYEYVNYPIHQGSDFNVDFPGNIYKYFKDRGYIVPNTLSDKFDASQIVHIGKYVVYPDDGLHQVSGESYTQDALKLQ